MADLFPLRDGDRGEGVVQLQRTLNAADWLKVDGEFGRATELAVSSFQVSAGLPATGAVDEATAEELEKARRRAVAGHESR